MSTPQKIGFIGLGIMGAPMCGHLIAADHQLFVHTRSRVPAEIAEAGATPCASPRAIGVSLPNTATAQELFNACAADGGRAWDQSTMVRALETLANFEIGQSAPDTAPGA